MDRQAGQVFAWKRERNESASGLVATERTQPTQPSAPCRCPPARSASLPPRSLIIEMHDQLPFMTEPAAWPVDCCARRGSNPVLAWLLLGATFHALSFEDLYPVYQSCSCRRLVRPRNTIELPTSLFLSGTRSIGLVHGITAILRVGTTPRPRGAEAATWRRWETTRCPCTARGAHARRRDARPWATPRNPSLGRDHAR